MKVIWKYELPVMDLRTLQMPEGAEILSAQMQRNKLCLWAMVESENKKVDRYIEIIGTGNPVEETLNVVRIFIDTIQLYGGDLIFHVFERIFK